MDVKEIKDIVDNSVKDLEGKNQKAMEAVKAEIVKEISEKGYKTDTEVNEAIEKAVKEAKEGLEKEILAVKKAAIATKEKSNNITFKDAIGNGLKEIKSELSALKNNSGKSANAMLFKANEENVDEGNFANDALDILTQDRSRGLYENPFGPVWFRDLLPRGTASGGTIQYLKENGFQGAAAVWDGTGAIESLGNKPGVSPLFDSVTETLIWIAGITRVKREMLDDISWLQGYLARQLTIGRKGLWVAENTQIFNKLSSDSVAYDGTKTVPIEIIYDAAFGQLRDNYYNPTTILMNSRDVVSLIALNKSNPTGMYDLPPGTVAVINGQLTIGGVQVVGAPNVASGDYVIFDKSATELIVRMSPEVRFFEEDRDNVPKNLVTVRAEERILPLIYDDNAVISGSFSTT